MNKIKFFRGEKFYHRIFLLISQVIIRLKNFPIFFFTRSIFNNTSYLLLYPLQELRYNVSSCMSTHM